MMGRTARKRKRTQATERDFQYVKAPRSLKAFVTSELEDKRKAFEAGNLGALLDALILCCEYKRDLPQWVGLGAIGAIKDGLLKTPEGKKYLRRHRSDMIDLSRAEMVEECRADGVKWVDAYGEAAKRLAGTREGGTEDAIEKSYKRFKHNQARDPFRYHIPNSIGLAPSPFPGGRK